MKIGSLFGNLNAAIDLMGAEKRGDFKIDFVKKEREKTKIDQELISGKDIFLKEISVDSGLLSYEGRQILLYIKDHGKRFGNAIRNPKEKGNKYHVADCEKLKEMREDGRLNRYVVTNDTSGRFLISGQNGEEGSTELAICQKCLKALNYQGWSTGGNHQQILDSFKMAEFFQAYSSFFSYLPSRKAQDASEGYTEDWAKISSHYRVDKNFTCESCGVNLRSNRNLLHVHHLNGVKSDNKISNLKALCIDCHSQQHFHEHMYVSHRDRQIIIEQRKQQGLSRSNWEYLIRYADPALRGVLQVCRRQGFHLPEVGFALQNQPNHILSQLRLDLAWPDLKFAVAIRHCDIKDGQKAGWQVISSQEFLDNYKYQGSRLRY